MSRRPLLAVPGALLCALPLLAAAADPAKPGTASSKKSHSAKVQAPKIELPSFGEVPKSDGLVGKKQEDALGTRPHPAGNDATYSVVSVQHARGFVHAGPMLKPVGLPLTEVEVSGTPPTTEKFSSVIRIKSPQRMSARIELALLDPRGDTAMSAAGYIRFAESSATDDAEYEVAWDPSPVRSGGTYQLLVRVAGQPLGTFPIKVAQPKP